MSQLPHVGVPVVLQDAGGQEYLSRVEGRRTDSLTLAVPAGLVAGASHGPGLRLELLWTVASGVRAVAIELVSARVENLVRLWDVAVVGEIMVDQRREFVRVPAFGRATMRVEKLAAAGHGAEGPGLPPLRGRLMDVSEASVRCTVQCAVDDLRANVGNLMICLFSLRDEQFTVGGVVHSNQMGATPRQTQLVVRFAQADSNANALRKHVFAMQLDMYRNNRRQG